MNWGTKVEKQRRLRIIISVAAYAYEAENSSIIDDPTFDAYSKMIDPTIKTGNKQMDKFFAETFDPDTGMWIRMHPQFDRIKLLYNKHYKGKTITFPLV